MCKREVIFFGVLFLWFIFVIVEILFFPVFARSCGVFVNLIPIWLLFCIIVPRYFSKKYNIWLESDFFKKNK